MLGSDAEPGFLLPQFLSVLLRVQVATDPGATSWGQLPGWDPWDPGMGVGYPHSHSVQDGGQWGTLSPMLT